MKRWVVSIIVGGMLLSLCGCAEQRVETIDITSEIPKESAMDNVQEQSVADSESSIDSVQSRSIISEIWDSGVVVDADVVTINEDLLSTYTSKLRVFTVDELTKTLGLSVESAVSSITDVSAEGYVPGTYTYLEFEDKQFLLCNMARFAYQNETFSKVKDLLILDGSEKNTALFLSEKDLSFATREQVKSEVQKVIDTLKIPVVDDPLCLTLDYETLVAENERQYAIALELAEGFGQSFLPEKMKISEDDACYMFYYPIAVDGMPVSPYLNGVYGDGSLFGGTQLIACYDKDGLAGLSLDYQPIIQEKREAKPAVSFEDILEKERMKYGSLILDGTYRIYDIRLEYIVQPVSSEMNTYNIVPVWRFSVEHRYEQSSKFGGEDPFEVVENTYDLFHAITGEELPFSMG